MSDYCDSALFPSDNPKPHNWVLVGLPVKANPPYGSWENPCGVLPYVQQEKCINCGEVKWVKV